MIKNRLNIRNLSTAQKHIFAIIFFAVLATILIFSWFRWGHFYGGGDVGIPSYDPGRIFDIAKYIWWEASAPGTTVPHGLTSVPFQFVQASLQNLGLSYVAIQAVVFWLILFFMGYGMNLLALTVFGRERIGLSLISGLFYMFNPYMMISVWHRFVHTTLFLASTLPFYFIFWSSWIKQGSLISLFVFLLVNLFSVYLFGTLAFIVVILILLIWIAAFEVFFPWKSFNHLKVVSARFIFGIIIWFFIHSWWLLPSVNIAPAIFSVQHSVGENLSTLLSISQQAIIPYSILGINPFYIYQQLDFGKIYSSPLFRILPSLILFFLIPGFIKAITSKKWLFWGLLLFLSLFLSKGAASPFGYTYVFSFSNIFTLGVLRNPFEKLGILIPFSSAILFSLGINFYFEYFKRKFLWLTKITIVLIIVLVFGVFDWPMWSGKLFGNYKKSAFVEIPQSYIELDKFIKNQANRGNILHLPLTTGESATYYWRYGYNGVESSQLYFNSLPSISRGFNITYVDDALLGLSSIFSHQFEDTKVIDLLRSFNVRFIILHKDMEWRGGLLQDPVKLEKILDGKNFLEKMGSFGDLNIYRLKEQYFAQILRMSQDIQYASIGEHNSFWPWLIKEHHGDLLIPLGKLPNDKLLSKSNEIVVTPKSTYSLSQRSYEGEDITKVLPATRILPDSFFYPLILLKEKALLFSMPETDKFIFKITLSGKRLAEAFKVKDKKKREIKAILSDYLELLPSIKEEIMARISGGIIEGEIPLESIFSRHLEVLNRLINKSEGKEKQVVLRTYDKLTEMLKSTNLLPNYQIIGNNDLPKDNRLVSQFHIPKDASYELLLAHQNSQKVYPSELNKLDVQIDNEIKSLHGVLQNDFISYGFINLSEGVHEISFQPVLSNNLLPSANDFEISGQVTSNDRNEFEVISSDHKPSYLGFQIEPLTGEGWYQLSFDSWIKLGDKFKVQLIQDSDPKDPTGAEEYLMAFNKPITREPYNNYWNQYIFNLHIRPVTTKATVRLLIEPWDDCRAVLVKKNLCQKREVRYPFEHPSEVAFKDISIKRILKNPLFLRSILPKKLSDGGHNSLEFVRHSPVLYSGQLNLKTPQFLIFSETYHPGWKLRLNDGKRDYLLSATYFANLFANAYFLENPGNYKFSLEFTPQNYFKVGFLISSVGWLGIIVLLLRQKFKK